MRLVPFFSPATGGCAANLERAITADNGDAIGSLAMAVEQEMMLLIDHISTYLAAESG